MGVLVTCGVALTLKVKEIKGLSDETGSLGF